MLRPVTEPRLEIVVRSGRTVARFAGPTSLTEYNADAVGRQFSRLTEGATPQNVLLDLSNVQFLTTSALGKLVGLNKRLRDHGGRLTVANPSPMIREVLHITHLDSLLDVQ